MTERTELHDSQTAAGPARGEPVGARDQGRRPDGETIAGVMRQGTAAIATLLGEVSRLVVLAGLLWGAGDLAILLIDVGHDVRAARILLGRQATQHSRELKEASAPRAAT